MPAGGLSTGLARPQDTTREGLPGSSGRGAVPRPARLPQKPLGILKSGEATLPKHDQVPGLSKRQGVRQVGWGSRSGPVFGTGVKNQLRKAPRFVILPMVLSPEFPKKRSRKPPKPQSVHNAEEVPGNDLWGE